MSERNQCVVEGCDKTGRLIRGMCDKHSTRYYRHGDPLWTPPTAEQRFRAFIGPTTDEGCHPWTGKIGSNGYGHFSGPDGRSIGAHRYALILDGRDPGESVDHLCHDPEKCSASTDCPHRRCVNPEHLKSVPIRENILRGGAPPAVAARRSTCKRGHDLTPENSYTPEGTTWRICRTCGREKMRRIRAARREAA